MSQVWLGVYKPSATSSIPLASLAGCVQPAQADRTVALARQARSGPQGQFQLKRSSARIKCVSYCDVHQLSGVIVATAAGQRLSIS